MPQSWSSVEPICVDQFGHLAADLFITLLQLRDGAGILAEQAQPQRRGRVRVSNSEYPSDGLPKRHERFVGSEPGGL
jgi:hypothetical protein